MRKLIILLISGALLYAIFQQNFLSDDSLIPEPAKQGDEAQKNTELYSPPQYSGNLLEKTLSKVLINILKTDEGKLFFENILQPINQPLDESFQKYKINSENIINSMFDIKTFGEGKEGPASCGHVVTINYKIIASNNQIVKENTETFALGSETIFPSLDAIIVGMKTGQTRHAIISSKYISNLSNKYSDFEGVFKVNITLDAIIPRNFIDKSVKIFDDEIAYNMPLMCGNRVIFDAKITKLSNGEIIFNSKNNDNKIDMKIGDLNYPIIISHSLHNKIPVGTRTVIAKGNLFKSFASKNSIMLPKNDFTENEYFMLELTNFENNIVIFNDTPLETQFRD